MVMKISTKGRYALRLMIDLAQHDRNTCIALKDIAERQNISMKYMEQITSLLCKAGFLKSIRGAQGGYTLARESNTYTIGSILRVTEGNLAPVSCLENETNLCARVDFCPTLSFWQGLEKVINDYTDSVTLEDLVQQNLEINRTLDFTI